MCAVVPSAAICTDKTLFTLNISNKNAQTLAAHQTRVLYACATSFFAGWARRKGLYIHSVLSVQIAGIYKQPSFWYQCGLLDCQCRQLYEKFVLIWYFMALKFAKMK